MLHRPSSTSSVRVNPVCLAEDSQGLRVVKYHQPAVLSRKIHIVGQWSEFPAPRTVTVGDDHCRPVGSALHCAGEGVRGMTRKDAHMSTLKCSPFYAPAGDGIGAAVEKNVHLSSRKDREQIPKEMQC